MEAIPQIGSAPAQDSPQLISPRATAAGGGVFGKELESQIQAKKSEKDDGTFPGQKTKKNKASKDSKTGAEPLTSAPPIRIDPNLREGTMIPISLAVTAEDAGSQSAAVAKTSSNPVAREEGEAKTSAAIASTVVPAETIFETASDESTRSLAEVKSTAPGQGSFEQGWVRCGQQAVRGSRYNSEGRFSSQVGRSSCVATLNPEDYGSGGTRIDCQRRQ